MTQLLPTSMFVVCLKYDTTAANIHAQTKGITFTYSNKNLVSFFRSLIKPSRSLMDIAQQYQDDY
jgi:hypothetical protein